MGDDTIDVFVEQLTRKKRDRKDYAIMVGAGILGIVTLAISMLIAFLGPFLLIIVADVFIGIYYVSVSRSLEYECNTTNGDFIMNQIINRRSCKRIRSFDLRTAEEMGQYNVSMFQNRNFTRQLMVDESDEGTDTWYLIVHLKDSDSALLMLSPNERVPVVVKPFLPRQVSANTFRGS